MSRRPPGREGVPPLAPALAWGLLGGALALVPCCCLWAPTALTGWLAAQQGGRQDPALRNGRSGLRLGATAGLVSALVGGSLATAAFLALGGGDAQLVVDAEGALARALLGWAGDFVDQADGAFAYGLITATASLIFSTLGGWWAGSRPPGSTRDSAPTAGPRPLTTATTPPSPKGPTPPRPEAIPAQAEPAAAHSILPPAAGAGEEADPDLLPTVRDERSAWGRDED